jgi:hypothetical protein
MAFKMKGSPINRSTNAGAKSPMRKIQLMDVVAPHGAFSKQKFSGVGQYQGSPIGTSPMRQIDYSTADTGKVQGDVNESWNYNRNDKYTGLGNTTSDKLTKNTKVNETGGHTTEYSTAAKGTKYAVDQLTKKKQWNTTKKVVPKVVKKKLRNKLITKIALKGAGPVGWASAVYDVGDFGVQVYNKGLKKAWKESLVGSFFYD